VAVADERRFDLAPLVQALALPDEDAAKLGHQKITRRLHGVVSQATVRRARVRGLTAVQADRLAVKVLGMHPAQVWGREWWDSAPEASIPG
jgi:hypothetical protein